MTLDLNGVKIKIKRADHHATDLQRLVESLFDPPPECFRVEVDPSGLHHTFWTTTVPKVDPQWSAILGDFLTNMRASLDHLAYQLVRLDGGKPTKNTKFPIFKSAYDHEGHVRLADISPGIRDATIRGLLDEVQPYKRGEGASALNHQLWSLNSLVNSDKHRLLLVVEMTVDQRSFWFGLDADIKPPTPWISTEPVADNMHVATFDFPGAPPRREFDPHLSLAVRLDEGPAGGRLRMITLREVIGDIQYFVNERVMMKLTPLFPARTPGHPGPAGHW